MVPKTFIVTLVLSSAALVAVILSPLYVKEPPPSNEEISYEVATELNVNMKDASFYCSHYGKEWHICFNPFWGPLFYCPAFSELNETDLDAVEGGTLWDTCITCPETANFTCSEIIEQVLSANTHLPPFAYGLLDAYSSDFTHHCEIMCKAQKEGESCNQNNTCTAGRSFCDYGVDDVELKDGTCKLCPTDPNDCFDDSFAVSTQSKLNCRGCELVCFGAHASKLWVGEESIPNMVVDGATQSSRQEASGTLHDCSVLALDEKNTCPGAEGKMCLVALTNETTWKEWKISNQAEKSGCVGLVAFTNFYHFYTHDDSELLIPFVNVQEEYGSKFLSEDIGGDAKVEVEVVGTECFELLYSPCRANSHCIKEDEFCVYHSIPTVDEVYEEGDCFPCPRDSNGEPDPLACYFDRSALATIYMNYDGTFLPRPYPDTVQNVVSCAEACEAAAALSSKSCKFCSDKLTKFEFTESEEGRCVFCPQNDVLYPERIVSLFGDTVTCSDMDTFFRRLPVPEDSSNCQLAQSMNYICGCEGKGYGGANTLTKQSALAWMPRVSAILSMLGSMFIIIDTQRTKLQRSKLINKLLCSISFFDAVGSFALAFTTLPTPKEDYLYGSRGTDATCTVQGFFIQMGTIACLLGVSLAVYYNLAIKQGWSETKMKTTHVVYYLLTPPILIGLVFACVGIPHYDNVLMWCNNSAKWWPELPVVLSIFYTTAIMGDVLFHVYKQEKSTSRYTGGQSKLFKLVFKQAFLFVGAFYITWTPYLILQYMLSSGKGYDMYGLILAASTMVPLQGFWNFVVYAKPRYFNRNGSAKLRSNFGSVVNKVSKRTSKTLGRKESNATQPDHHVTSTAKTTSAKRSVTSGISIAKETEFIPFDAPNSPEDNCYELNGNENFMDNTLNARHNHEASAFNDELNTSEPKNDQNSTEDEDARLEMLLAG